MRHITVLLLCIAILGACGRSDEKATGTVRDPANSQTSGDKSIKPADPKVKADAAVDCVVPGEQGQKATVVTEERSKCGVAKSNQAFNTAAGAYSIQGGADDFHGRGVICDISMPFTVQGSGVLVKFTPSSAQGGSYSYSGNMSGFDVWGSGTYTVKYQGKVAVAITATGPGSVKTPMGTQTRSDTEQYTLTSTAGDGCQ